LYFSETKIYKIKKSRTTPAHFSDTLNVIREILKSQTTPAHFSDTLNVIWEILVEHSLN